MKPAVVVWSTCLAVIAGSLWVGAQAPARGAATPSATAQQLSPAPEFVPDTIFTGSQLTGWQPIGGATWRAENGEIIGTPSSGGGWLLTSQSYQDVQMFSRFRCDGPCETGVLLRIEKSAAGMSGIFVSLKDGDLNSYRMTLDAAGRVLTRDLISNVTYGTIRTGAPPATPGAGGGRAGGGGAAAAAPAGRGGAPDAAGRGAAGQARGGGGGGRGGPTFLPNTPLPTPLPDLEMPAYGLAKQPNGAWDTLQIIYDSNIVRPHLNSTNEMGPAITDDTAAYGPVAFYVGGTSAVRFKDVSFKDLATRVIPPVRQSPRFRLQQLEEFSYAWGAAAADFNRDGSLDVTAGPYIYYGPDFTRRREVYVGAVATGYPPNMVSAAFDFTGDGWPDVLATESRAMALYVNPGTANRRWRRYPDAGPAVPVGGEAAVLRDINSDGRPEVIASYGGRMGFASYDPANPTAAWTVTPVAPPGTGYGHAAGAGDVNGDGRLDILGTAGWAEQPAAAGAEWIYHPVAFGRWGRSQTAGGGDIEVYDVNGDRLNDVVTSLHGHGWGLAWFEQRRDASGAITFVRHMIMDNYSTPNAGGVTFSELHALAAADIDGDGLKDIVTGKRYWSHQDSYFDPDPYGEPVLYWYRAVRNPKAPGGAEFVPELIHNRSGVGSQILATDLNKDGVVDLMTSTNRGTFLFFGVKR